jgi:hypothetical protein
MSSRVHLKNDGEESRMGGDRSPFAWKKSGPKRAERLAELGPKAYHLTYEQKANAEERKKNKPSAVKPSKLGRRPSKENVLAALAGGHLDSDPEAAKELARGLNPNYDVPSKRQPRKASTPKVKTSVEPQKVIRNGREFTITEVPAQTPAQIDALRKQNRTFKSKRGLSN